MPRLYLTNQDDKSETATKLKSNAAHSTGGPVPPTLELLSYSFKGTHDPPLHSFKALLSDKFTAAFLLHIANLQASLPSNMQHNGVASIAYHSSMDFTSLFLFQDDPHIHDLNPLDMVGPYDCNGNSAANSMPAGAANDQARHDNDERKKRRLASNRESARRSRVRKQKRLDELSSRVAQLRATNQRLLVELNHMIGKLARTVHENAKLREEASDLQERLDQMEVEEAEAGTRTPDWPY